MSSDTKIEMSPMPLRTPRSGRPALHLDIDRARPRSRSNSQDQDSLHDHEQKNHQEEHPASKPLLSPAAPLAPLAPLLETDLSPQKPPLAGPEVDDLGDSPEDHGPFPGIDDGLLEPETTDRTQPHLPDEDEVDGQTDNQDRGEKPDHDVPHENGGHHMHEGDDGKLKQEVTHELDEVDYFGDLMTPYGFESRFGEDRPISPGPNLRVIPDVNVYQQKKNLAQGMMDLALLSANANQLRYVIESAEGHPYFWPSIIFISLSIIFQIFVGIGLIWNSAYNVKNEDDICKADKINNLTVIGIFLVTIVNVFITAFSVAQRPIMGNVQ